MFFLKKGGYSNGVYTGLNCGRGSKDKKRNILKFKLRIKENVNQENNLILMHQTHSKKVIEIKRNNYNKTIYLTQ